MCRRLPALAGQRAACETCPKSSGQRSFGCPLQPARRRAQRPLLPYAHRHAAAARENQVSTLGCMGILGMANTCPSGCRADAGTPHPSARQCCLLAATHRRSLSWQQFLALGGRGVHSQPKRGSSSSSSRRLACSCKSSRLECREVSQSEMQHSTGRAAMQPSSSSPYPVNTFV